MEIKAIEVSGDEGTKRLPTSNRLAVVVQPGPTEKRNAEAAAPREPARPAQPLRKTGLAQVVSKSLADAGLPMLGKTATASANPIQGAPSSKATEKEREQTQAFQAFMHSLVQASAGERNPLAAPTAAPVPGSESAPGTGANFANAAYTGLVSQLEGLARRLENPTIPGNDGPDMAELESAFGDLLAAGGVRNSGGSAEYPPLTTVIRNIARNLQSTGNPYLATTGHVINTAA